MAWTTESIKEVVQKNKVVVFGKGSKNMPQCGFSHRAYNILQEVGCPFEVINIFDDPSIRPALVEYSKWPTTPQIFVGGELVGGSDIALELFNSGELQKKITAALSA